MNHCENCIFTLQVVKHSEHTRLQKEFQPPMLAPSMIMPISRSRDESFLACSERWSGQGHWHIDQGEGWKSRWGDHPMSTWNIGTYQAQRRRSQIFGCTTTPGNYGRPLWPKIKIPGDESSCNNRPHAFITGTSLPLGAWPFAEESLPLKQAVG